MELLENESQNDYVQIKETFQKGRAYTNNEASESSVEVFEDTQRTQRQFSAKPVDKTRPDFRAQV